MVRAHTCSSLPWLGKQEFGFICPIKMWAPYFTLLYLTGPLQKTPAEWHFCFPVICTYVWSGCKTFEEQGVLHAEWWNPLQMKSCSLPSSISYMLQVIFSCFVKPSCRSIFPFSTCSFWNSRKSGIQLFRISTQIWKFSIQIPVLPWCS